MITMTRQMIILSIIGVINQFGKDIKAELNNAGGMLPDHCLISTKNGDDAFAVVWFGNEDDLEAEGEEYMWNFFDMDFAHGNFIDEARLFIGAAEQAMADKDLWHLFTTGFQHKDSWNMVEVRA